MFTAAIFILAKRWKQPKWPLMDEWIYKMWSIYTIEYHSALTRKEVLTHATIQMELEDIVSSEICQWQKDKYSMIPLIWSI